MYTSLLENYIFNPGTKTIVSLDLTQVRKECIQYIYNKTIHTLIWDRMRTAFGDIECSGNSIHFDSDNTDMSSTDVLEIGYIFQKPESLGIGLPIESAANTDTGEFPLIPLFKRLLERITVLINGNTSGDNKVQITDGAGVANTKTLGVQLTNTDVGLVSNTIIHGETTGGGGGYKDVKVTPSGALTVETTISESIPLSTKYDNTINIDAGGRLRTSQLTTLGDYKTLDRDDLVMLENIGTGTGLFSANKYNLSVTSGQYLIRRSKSYHHYFSGKSQTVEMTFDNFQSEADTVKRVGYFSSNSVAPYDSSKDGFWLENTGTTIDLVVSRVGTETLRINITNWDGYESLVTYNWENFTVIYFDFLWLGGAILRLFVKTELGFVLAHTFNYSGTAKDIMMLSPNQPIRYEIRSSTGTGSFRYICAQVATEGSIAESGRQKSIDTGSTDINVATIGVKYPVKAIRKKTTSRDKAVKIIGAQLFVSSNTDRALMTVELNPTLSAALTFTDVTNSDVQEANGNGTITVTAQGTKLYSKYITQNTVFDSKVFEADFLTWLDESILDESDTIVVCITPLTATIAANAAINYKEF